MAADKKKFLLNAQKQVQKGQLDRAIMSFKAILKIDPNDIKVHNMLGDLVGTLPSRPAVVEALAEGFREVWGVDLAPGDVTEEERRLAGRLEHSKYLSRDWNGPVRSGRFA